MRLLLLDTCGAEGTLALAETETATMLAAAALPGRSASERLVPAVRELLAARGETVQALGAIAVVHGPGSFTGVRVGVSVAKGLSEALAVPAIAISRLAVLAELAESTSLANVYALLDAGRGEFYVGHYAGESCVYEALLGREQLVCELSAEPGASLVACEAVVADALAGWDVQLVADPAAGSALRLALERVRAGRFDDVALLDANYVRRTDAEIFAKPAAKAVRL